YDVGYNHFWHAPSPEHGGDLVFVQGHSAPGVYARAFMLGRLTEEQMDHFRQEVGGKGISSYPHPWLMPDFWQFPTVSMGLGPLRGNGKIIQELEAEFRGAGWNVIKVVWGTHWDTLLARDKKGILMRRMMECVDGEYQTFKSKDGAYVREYFFNTPELKELVA